MRKVPGSTKACSSFLLRYQTYLPEQVLVSRPADPLESSAEFKVTPFKTAGGRSLGEGVCVAVALVRAGKMALKTGVLLGFVLLAINDTQD